jgi:hypothetical protein
VILQLDPPIPIFAPNHGGAGFCFAWIDYSQEHDTIWKCLITATQDWWDIPQPQVKGIENITMGRKKCGSSSLS